jgi:flagellar hook-length control protein FliK
MPTAIRRRSSCRTRNHGGTPTRADDGLGKVIVEAVREGRAQTAAGQPAGAEAAPGRTIRQLVHEAVAMVREQVRTAATSVEAPRNPDAPDTPASTPAIAKALSDSVPELRPMPADVSSKGLPQAAIQVIAANGGDTASPDAVTTQSREPVRAPLPPSVDVRDVGDFTVRSVRYLSGRTEETVTVRLVPRSLGELQIAVRTSAEGLDVILTAAGHAARDRLEVQIMGLRDLLAREGLDVNRVTVQAPPAFDLSGQMPSHQNHHSQHGHAARFNAQAFREPEPDLSETPQQRTGRPQHEGGLNMLA